MTENITYNDILKSHETLNDDDAVFAQWSNVYEMTAEERKKAVEEILLQPYMKDVYVAHGIEPGDIKEFIQTIKDNRTVSENIILNNSNIFQQNKENSKDMDGDGKSDGNNNKVDSYEEKLSRKNQLIDAFERIMQPFAEKKKLERTPPVPEPTKLHKRAKKLLKAFLEVGRVTAIATGLFATTYTTTEMLKENNDKPNNKDNTEKRTVSEKQNNKTTYTSWAKAAERNRSSR